VQKIYATEKTTDVK